MQVKNGQIESHFDKKRVAEKIKFRDHSEERIARAFFLAGYDEGHGDLLDSWPSDMEITRHVIRATLNLYHNGSRRSDILIAFFDFSKWLKLEVQKKCA